MQASNVRRIQWSLVPVTVAVLAAWAAIHVGAQFTVIAARPGSA